MLDTTGDVTVLILDFADAYHAIPLHPAERRFACCDVGDAFLVYDVLGFGGKEYTLVCCRHASFVSRTTQGFADPGQARLQLYMRAGH